MYMAILVFHVLFSGVYLVALVFSKTNYQGLKALVALTGTARYVSRLMVQRLVLTREKSWLILQLVTSVIMKPWLRWLKGKVGNAFMFFVLKNVLDISSHV